MRIPETLFECLGMGNPSLWAGHAIHKAWMGHREAKYLPDANEMVQLKAASPKQLPTRTKLEIKQFKLN